MKSVAGSRSVLSSHQSKITPEIFQAVRAAEKRSEIRGVDENDVSCALFFGGHPDEAVELSVSGLNEGCGRSRSIGWRARSRTDIASPPVSS